MSLHRRSVVRVSAERVLLVILALSILAGCGSAPRAATPPTPAPNLPPVATPVASTALPTATPAPATAIPTALPTSSPAPTPAPTAPRFGPAWGDRAVYRPGLVPVEQQTLPTAFPGASEYRIDLAIDDSLTRVSGQQQVRYTNRENAPLSDIYVRLFPNALGGKMTVSDVTIDGKDATWEYKFADTAVRVVLPQPLAVGQSTVLTLDYRIEVPQSLDTGYGLLSYTDGILALDTPYAPIPVYNEEGWNVETPPENADTSFNDPSFYLVRVSAPARLKLVAAGVEVERSADGGRQVVTYAQGPARDFFVAGSPDYVVTTQQVGDTRVNSYALPGEEKAQAIALDAAAKGLGIYGKRFGPYPYSEFDVAATPMLALGIEYPGAVGISRRIYEPDYKPGSGPASAVVEGTVAHELAHQWFYNLVGNDQVDQPWLDEALAQYSVWMYFVDRYGPAAGEPWKANWGARWDRTDREKKAVGLPAADYDQREYSSIVYGRGPLFLDALAKRMGQAQFDEFLADYAARYRWGIVTTADFKAMADKACGCDLSDLYREWLDP